MTQKKQLSTQNALKARSRAKRKKPAFVRPESWRYDKFSESWRRPRGLDNKIRRKIKGWPPAPSMGYKGPKIARGLHPSGYEEVLVHNVAELAKVNSETQAVRIAHTVGKKKRVQIISEAKKLGLVILNFKEVKEPVKEEEAKEEAKPEKAEEKPAEKPAEKKKEKLKKPEKPKPKKAAKGEKPKKTGKKPKTEEGAKKQ
jgi:large subunit ribosomal protein L32e